MEVFVDNRQQGEEGGSATAQEDRRGGNGHKELPIAQLIIKAFRSQMENH